MTFMEMIQGLDEKHRARCGDFWADDMWIVPVNPGHGYTPYMNQKTQERVIFMKGEILATDWILEEIK